MVHERIGKYEIVDELGRGTMGIVYKALDPVLNRHVALKTLAASGSNVEDSLQRFQREAQAAALLTHPNVVTIHDFGREGELLYIAMELLDGRDLRQAMDSGALLGFEEKLRIVDCVLAALEYAHDRGVVHRDIKPANIRLGVSGQVKLVDFGLARVNSSEMTQEGIVLGTPNYMSPEQAMGERVDGRSDVFSVGSVFYELVTGHRPFEAETTPGVLFQVVHKQAPPVRQWAPVTPPAIANVIERALCKDKNLRYASARAMRDDLTRARAAIAPGPSASSIVDATAAANASSSGAAVGLGSQAAHSAGSTSLRPVADARPAGSGSKSVDGSRRAGSGPGRSGTARTRPPHRGVPWLALLVALGVVALAAGVWAWRERQGAGAGPAPSSAEVGALTQALAATQLQLAQRELDGKNYAGAVKASDEVLRLSPGHPQATAVRAEARRKLNELERAVATARLRLAAHDTDGAARQLSRILELDPRHPDASSLSARLNNAFLVQAEQAKKSMQAAQAAAVAAGLQGTEEFEKASASARSAQELEDRGEYADATRLLLEARDGFERARLTSAAASSTTADSPTASAETPQPHTTGGPALTTPPGSEAEGGSVERHFSAEPTVVVNAVVSGGLRRPVEFQGRLLFDVSPGAVHAGDSFLVRIRLANDGRENVRLRSLALSTLSAGRRETVPVAGTIPRELPAGRTVLLAEYSGTWRDLPSWSLEAVVTSEREETIRASLGTR